MTRVTGKRRRQLQRGAVKAKGKATAIVHRGDSNTLSLGLTVLLSMFCSLANTRKQGPVGSIHLTLGAFGLKGRSGAAEEVTDGSMELMRCTMPLNELIWRRSFGCGEELSLCE